MQSGSVLVLCAFFVVSILVSSERRRKRKIKYRLETFFIVCTVCYKHSLYHTIVFQTKMFNRICFTALRRHIVESSECLLNTQQVLSGRFTGRISRLLFVISTPRYCRIDVAMWQGKTICINTIDCHCP